MSYSCSMRLDCRMTDIGRIEAGFVEALRRCAEKRPLYADARLLPAVTSDGHSFAIHVKLPAALVEKRGMELSEPQFGPDDDGTYMCTYEVVSEGDGVLVMMRSSRSSNGDAWMTGTTLLDAAAAALGGVRSG